MGFFFINLHIKRTFWHKYNCAFIYCIIQEHKQELDDSKRELVIWRDWELDGITMTAGRLTKAVIFFMLVLNVAGR